MSIPFGHLCKYVGTQVLGKAYAKDLEKHEMMLDFTNNNRKEFKSKE